MNTLRLCENIRVLHACLINNKRESRESTETIVSFSASRSQVVTLADDGRVRVRLYLMVNDDSKTLKRLLI